MKKLASARPIHLAILLILVALLVAGPALAQDLTAPGRDAVSAPQQQGPTDPAELEAFLDDVLADQMEEGHVAGATVAVVKDGELFFTKGYGYADLENGTPVDPYQTLFNIGSASKIFVWTAVMQLAEQGKVDLNTDVNTYLKKDVQIPATFPEPITLAHLMTHTDGFEELLTGIFPHEIESVPPLDVLIYEGGVARVRPPGTSPGYANYGTALAAYIVQEVSGVPFEQYVEDNIYDPLGMARSTFRQPVPPGLADDLAVGYSYDCIIRAMPTIDSDGCRPPVPDHADHLFRSHGVQFFRGAGIGGRLGSDSVDGMLRNLNEQADPIGSGAG